MRFGPVKIPSRWNAALLIAYNPLRGAYNLFETFRLWIPWCYPSTTAHSFDIPIPVVAHYRPPNAPDHLFTSDSLRCCRNIAVAQVFEPAEKENLVKLGSLRSLQNTAPCARNGMGGIDVLIGWTGMQHGWRIQCSLLSTRAGFLGPRRTTLGGVSRIFVIKNHTDGRYPME